MGERRLWQCPQCGKRFRIPVEADDPVACEECEPARSEPLASPVPPPLPRKPAPRWAVAIAVSASGLFLMCCLGIALPTRRDGEPAARPAPSDKRDRAEKERQAAQEREAAEEAQRQADAAASRDLADYLALNYVGTSWIGHLQSVQVSTGLERVTVQTRIFPDSDAPEPAGNMATAVLTWAINHEDVRLIRHVVVKGQGDSILHRRENPRARLR